ncbi:helix-turn-helix domain-containing protein [Caldalkalibacillus thermarum]|uniref:helix-turn-helix domain-containing protein n=1 Tax=Caldalkalibacillus thermarum TaxID=296745 RepID=UPI00166F239D|nr:helix-turn-helix transcriptional regulator [Caldalkalibacillus thermarum]
MNLVKKARLNKGLTQVQLAHKAKIAQAYLSEIENNKVEPSIRVYRKLAKALGVSVSELLEDDEQAS